MLKTPRDFQFDSIPMAPKVDYVIAPNDLFSFRLFANDGFKVIDLAAGTNADPSVSNIGMNRVGQSFISYLVRQDGKSRLPMLGDVIGLDGLCYNLAGGFDGLIYNLAGLIDG